MEPYSGYCCIYCSNLLYPDIKENFREAKTKFHITPKGGGRNQVLNVNAKW